MGQEESYKVLREILWYRVSGLLEIRIYAELDNAVCCLVYDP